MRVSKAQLVLVAVLSAVALAMTAKPAQAEDGQSRYAVAWKGGTQCGSTVTETLC